MSGNLLSPPHRSQPKNSSGRFVVERERAAALRAALREWSKTMASILRPSLLVMAALIGGATGVLAQSGANDTLPRDQPQQATPITPGNGARPDSGTDLSRKLAHSRGVIAPPKTNDSAVKVPPNDEESSMPVVPPPGTPGGRQDVQPK
jgi:hypothetical protein